MNKKAIFLDIDGTISHFGEVRPSAIQGIKKARENGHKILLCTGRALEMIDEDIIKLGFDGIVASAGAYVEVDGNILFHKTINKNLLNSAIDYFEKYELKYFLETNTKLYGTEENIMYQKTRIYCMQKKWPQIQRKENNNKLNQMETMLSPTCQLKNREDVNKISFTSDFRKVEQIKKDWEGKLMVIPATIEEMGDGSGEISQIGITKATGIQHAIKFLGFSREATMAVGDGSNDFEMLEYANIGIAMGNALEELKKTADYVTNSIDEDGLYNCFQKYGLLT